MRGGGSWLRLLPALLFGCSALGLSDDIVVDRCERDADCAELAVTVDASACRPPARFVCGDEGYCERVSTAGHVDAGADRACDGEPSQDAGASGE
ncbi:MAG: hypothetical protein OXT09_30770 [Myxococcales bacterium]|nr:hypothetical protein [Myxococcales bacterium]